MLQRVADLVQWSVATAPPGVHVLMAGDFKIDCAHLLPTPQIKQLGPTLAIQQIPGILSARPGYDALSRGISVRHSIPARPLQGMLVSMTDVVSQLAPPSLPTRDLRPHPILPRRRRSIIPASCVHRNASRRVPLHRVACSVVHLRCARRRDARRRDERRMHQVCHVVFAIHSVRCYRCGTRL